jgi:hypothetical protein
MDGNLFEEVAANALDAVVLWSLRDGRRLIEENTVASGMRIENAGKLRSNSSADICDDGVSAPIE